MPPKKAPPKKESVAAAVSTHTQQPPYKSLTISTCLSRMLKELAWKNSWVQATPATSKFTWKRATKLVTTSRSNMTGSTSYRVLTRKKSPFLKSTRDTSVTGTLSRSKVKIQLHKRKSTQKLKLPQLKKRHQLEKTNQSLKKSLTIGRAQSVMSVIVQLRRTALALMSQRKSP